MNWDDLRFVAALSRHGSLARTATLLDVDHTTVGRRIDSAERTLGLRLFTRTPSGYVLTQEGEQLVAPLRALEDAVLTVERGAQAQRGGLQGSVRITCPETFGVSYLAPRLARFGRLHPGLRVDLKPAGAVLDLSRREAEVAVRFFRTRHERVVVRHVGDVTHGLYASPDYLARRPLKSARELRGHPLLLPSGGVELAWVKQLAPGVEPVFVSEVSLALAEAAREGAGVTVLPRYLGDITPGLQHLPMARAPSEPLWLSVHRDLRQSPRVRVLLDFLVAAAHADRKLLTGS